MYTIEPKALAHITTLTERYPALKCCEESIIKAYQLIEQSYISGNKLLVAGNGGSAADSEHIVGELMKSFKLRCRHRRSMSP